MIFIAGISIAVFIELLLISKKDKSLADRVLALWMFCISLHLFLFYFWFIDEIYQYPFLLGLEKPLPLVHGVFLYLYVGALTGQLPRRRKWTLLHFIPAASVCMYLIPFFILPPEEKVRIYRQYGAGYEMFEAILFPAILLSGPAYIVWSLLLLRRHTRRILDQFSYQHKVDLQWLRILVWGLAGIWILVFVSNETLLFGGVVVFIFLIGFFGIRQVRIFSDGAPDEEEEREKYSKSGLTEEKSDELYRALVRLMTEDALYRKNDLSVSDLADKLNVHANYLSQVINAREGMNFYDFVNKHRLEEFKRLISDPANHQLTLLALAFDCGFNSKSSFNRYFKKATGQTPSEFFASINKQ